MCVFSLLLLLLHVVLRLLQGQRQSLIILSGELAAKVVVKFLVACLQRRHFLATAAAAMIGLMLPGTLSSMTRRSGRGRSR